jgi:hypothetical protein
MGGLIIPSGGGGVVAQRRAKSLNQIGTQKLSKVYSNFIFRKE